MPLGDCSAYLSCAYTAMPRAVSMVVAVAILKRLMRCMDNPFQIGVTCCSSWMAQREEDAGPGTVHVTVRSAGAALGGHRLDPHLGLAADSPRGSQYSRPRSAWPTTCTDCPVRSETARATGPGHVA